MDTVHLTGSSLDSTDVVAKVIADAQPTLVKIDSGESVVVMPLDEFHSWQETAYLLSNPANAMHLRKSIDQVRTKTYNERELDEA
ncbi:type II toxin-antitoxin system Phd/YefM family antitoxin [Bythopirellula polymerisocia]|uniref:Antitoxin n=1 Tax=Bythopirellula polymerisocia TaxID=2528003 RepID=A0A5C6CXZ8_9BACT|nr:type II toxin-antitoxin system Phd/YefM family antitoxin [Bythopirellula polymerisocia]TWU28427.1 Antitoxin YefM [Bythopirellula polymerisocia]